MGRFKILLFAVTLFLALIPDTEAQWQPPKVAPRPPCPSQIALANLACAMLPYSTMALSPPSVSLSDNHESHGPPPNHRHLHTHWHGHQHQISLSPMEENCCKWVQQLDSQCLCRLLSRLPAFLERPQHKISFSVGGSCNATFSCGGGTII
ncbi:uncharacterized protein LOC111807420 [Cucurbita pepo subsp. pepo]|uniref:uncharacterized protein LOC111807420 n=1 Tax=Cucurbita pepo subsp. pepo TaxID=3664 RepID=UPI000C9D438A|nr:uncharacterized protein LOC111807420 [Cucurbita pepo subsp. pepo]